MNNIADYKLVRNSMIGSELSEDKAKILAEKMGVRHLKDGELLVEEGGSDSTLYILAAGGIKQWFSIGNLDLMRNFAIKIAAAGSLFYLNQFFFRFSFSNFLKSRN